MSRKGPIFWRAVVLVTLAGLVAGGLVYQLTKPADNERSAGGAGSTASPADRPPNVIFVVLDMLRADHLSLCGYERPTTPNLVRLSRRASVVRTCRAYSPGTWTLPSHASFFTGDEVVVHGADSLGRPEGKRSVSLWGDPVRPLPATVETLAEQMAADGYRTVLVSGNPIVSRWSETGLDRGFEVIRESKAFGDAYGDELIAALDSALGEAGDEQPLFLFINICDAHHPWLPVPAEVGWVRSRPALDNRPRFPDTPYPRFLRGQMTDEERAAFLEHARDSYDFAVWRADLTLAKAVRVLRARGVADPGYRLVVTSDHGEFLGEHDLLSHAIFTYEPDTRVPLLYLDSSGRGPDLHEPISALAAYDLARHGELRKKPRPVRAVGYPDALMTRLFGEWVNHTTAAWWTGKDKLFWKSGEFSLFDLETDPDELAPSPLPADHPLRAAFEEYVEHVKATADRPADATPEMIEALRRLGYVE